MLRSILLLMLLVILAGPCLAHNEYVRCTGFTIMDITVPPDPITNASRWNLVNNYRIPLLINFTFNLPSGLTVANSTARVQAAYGMWSTGNNRLRWVVVTPGTPAVNIYFSSNTVLFPDPATVAITALGINRQGFDPHFIEPDPGLNSCVSGNSPTTLALNAANYIYAFSWWDQSADPPILATDLQSIVLHELGHVIGLGHCTVFGAVMQPFYSRGTRYTLQTADLTGVSTLYGPPTDVDTERGLAVETLLSFGYPNPFNGETHIGFQLASPSVVKLEIYDILGRMVKTIEEGTMSNGKSEATWDAKDMFGRDVASGVYLCRMVVSPIESPTSYSVVGIKSLLLVK